jgi:L-alanine-DL-glutamate epimerase-like enolase superfamily enzyme
MRRHLGQDFPLMADANMRWSRDEALKACQALRDYSLFWIEEPLIPEDETGHAMLATTGGIPIAAGENFRTIHEFARLIRAEGVMFPEADVSNCGGITPWMKIAALAECNNLKVTSHGVHDLHVHLLAAVPNKSYLEVHGFGLERYISDPLSIEEGFATAPDTPGHGVVLDWEALEEMRV